MVDLAALDANLKLPEARMPDGATFVQPVGVPDGTGAGHAVNRGQLAAATRTLAAGENVTITDAGGVVTIAATGGGAVADGSITDAKVAESGISQSKVSGLLASLSAKVDKGDAAISVKAHGAKGDGVTDDTAAIQSAIDAAATRGGGRVIVPPGIYIFTQIVIKTAVHLDGNGGVLKVKDGTCIDAAASYYPISNNNGSSGGFPGARIENLTIDGNRANNPAALVADAITLAGENVHCRHNTILSPTDSGVMFSRVTNGSLIGNRIDDALDVGIYVNDGDGTQFSEVLIKDNQITNSLNGGIALKRVTQRAVVANNTIYNCGHGITLEHGSTASDYSTNLTISDNRIRRVGYINSIGGGARGINLRRSSHVVCADNRIEDSAGRGILVEGCSNSALVGNVVSLTETNDGTNGVGIDFVDRDGIGNRGNTITGNIVTGGGYAGIRLGGTAASQANTFAGNVLTGAASRGLSVTAAWTKNSFTGNTLSATTYDYVNTAAAVDNVWIANTSINATFTGNLAANTDYTPALNSTGTVRAFAGSATLSTTIGNTGAGAAGLLLQDAGLYRSSAGVVSTNSGNSLRVNTGTWNSGRLIMGSYHFWVDAAGQLRIKNAVPTSDLDGSVVGRAPIAVTTAGRPTAASIGAGGTVFDTTLNQPIWSTGSAWVTAGGTAA